MTIETVDTLRVGDVLITTTGSLFGEGRLAILKEVIRHDRPPYRTLVIQVPNSMIEKSSREEGAKCGFRKLELLFFGDP